MRLGAYLPQCSQGADGAGNTAAHFVETQIKLAVMAIQDPRASQPKYTGSASASARHHNVLATLAVTMDERVR